MTGVCVVVVSYQAERLLEPCLASVEACLSSHSGRSRLLVVDNGSTDGSVAVVRRRFPEAEIIELGGNHGFAGAVNAGVDHSDEEWLLLVNPDMTLAPTALEHLLAATEDAPEVGSVGAQIRFATDSDVINSAGIGVDALGIAFDRLLGRPVTDSEQRPIEVFGVSAGAALYRRSMLDQIGRFDESFFLYLEDVDVAWRARSHGWRAIYAPDALAFHEHSASTGHGSRSKYFYVGRNRVRVLAKNAERKQLLRHGLAMAAYDLGYCGYVALREHSLAPLRGRLRGLREWGAYRRSRRPGGSPVELAPATGVGDALRRNRTWARYSIGARSR